MSDLFTSNTKAAPELQSQEKCSDKKVDVKHVKHTRESKTVKK